MGDIVGLIPARGGSKAIPRKNLVEVGGRPLLAWTFAAAQESRSLTRVVLSTDHADIAELGRAYDVEVLERPPELAEDDTPMLDVVEHALSRLHPEILVLLQPTSPLRTAAHVDEAVALLLETGADAVVSVVEVPHRYTPASLMRIEDGRLVPLDPDGPLSRQRKPVLYARNGPAVLVLRAGRLDRRRGLYAGDCRPYLMDAFSSLDVDGPQELALADALLRSRSGSAGGSAP
jgi:CMP-N,N'-diacetyllegionaminic acid synthase